VGRTSDARERLVAAGTELFSERAYSSVGVAEIAARAGVQKGSFYYFFPSKEALALAVVDAHWVWQRGEWTAILARPGTALERLRGIFDATAQMQMSALRGTGVVTGCLFGNLALEVSAINPGIQKRLQEIFEEQVQIIAEHLTAAVDAGEIELMDARMAAKSIVAQLEGLVLFAKLFNDPGELDSLWENSLRLMGIVLPAGQSAQP
jgi:TetR/AcrR family transcriptional repressor of nem operon